MSDAMDFLGVMAGIVLCLVLVIAGLTVAGTRISKHYDHINCTQFGQQSGRRVRFVTYSFWSWDCLTPTADGKWISTVNLREFGQKP